jgi:hypothetical protein
VPIIESASDLSWNLVPHSREYFQGGKATRKLDHVCQRHVGDDAHLLQLVEKLDTPNRATSQSLVHGPPAPPPLKGQGERRRLGDVEAPSSAGLLPSDEGCGRENVGGSGGKDDVGSADGRRCRLGCLVKEAVGGLGNSAPTSGGYAPGAAGEGAGVLDPGPHLHRRLFCCGGRRGRVE